MPNHGAADAAPANQIESAMARNLLIIAVVMFPRLAGDAEALPAVVCLGNDIQRSLHGDWRPVSLPPDEGCHRMRLRVRVVHNVDVFDDRVRVAAHSRAGHLGKSVITLLPGIDGDLLVQGLAARAVGPSGTRDLAAAENPGLKRRAPPTRVTA